jgi:AraC family transcriptional regulator of adaptative response/methylated-DNA-[protein]-cysteine methyltransferase
MPSLEVRNKPEFGTLASGGDHRRADAPQQGEEAGLPIRSVVAECSLGSVLIATTERGVCAILLGDDPGAVRRELKESFPGAELSEGDVALDALAARVVALIEAPGSDLDLALDPRGTAFQQKVWQALREVPAGSTVSYSEIARRIGTPKEAYAVGEACAANKIAVAIPCHRIVRKDGGLAGYRWGFRRKRALLKREGVR